MILDSLNDGENVSINENQNPLLNDSIKQLSFNKFLQF